MAVRTWSLLGSTLALFTAPVGCTPTEHPDASATEPDSEGPPQMSFPPPPSSGDSEPAPTSTGSTGDVTTGAVTTGSGSTSVEPYCGDDHLDPGEECDLGRDNRDDGACTLLCKTATCGDGKMFAGYEVCDLGLLNVGSYGGCTADCELAAYCGDGVVDALFEECDLGGLNGAGVGDGDAPPCDAQCDFQARLVFLSSELYDGDLGGLDGADAKCRALAEAADLPDPENFRAWLSNGGVSPSTRFEGVAVVGRPYILLTGKIVADSFAELTQNGPRTGISVTETGATLSDKYVWTNTTAVGDPYSFSVHCDGWTSASGVYSAHIGYNALAVEFGPDFQEWKQQRLWTSFTDDNCENPYRLYCVEDGPAEG